MVHSYLRYGCLTGIVLGIAACSFSITTTQRHIVSITSSQDTMTVGALEFTGTIAIVDTTLRVSVMVKNDSTASVPYTAGCGVSYPRLALYRNAARSGTPVVELQPPPEARLCPIGTASLAPGDSVTFTAGFPLSHVRQVASGMYYVGVPLPLIRPNATNRITASAGTIMISGL